MTTQPTHTPGPWNAEGFEITCDRWSTLATVDRGATDMDDNVIMDSEAEANARLIAAAPEMLETLKLLTARIDLSKLNVSKDFGLMNAHACALKAIARVEGKI